jgi:NADPH:quinone reductase-like Zn-dependent oxidoreductase
MRAIWITKYGGPEVLQVRETPDPLARPGEIRVRVRAAGLNFAEVTARQGLYPDAPKPPCVVGYEGAGVVDSVGPGVKRWKVGQRVAFLAHFGAHSDVVTVREEMVIPMPDDMTFEAGAALPVNYLTAYHMLFEVRRIKPGDSVLVHMAAGGVGTAVLQLCRTVKDVTTIGTASASKHAYVQSNGCDHPIDYHSVDYVEEVRRITKGKGVNLVLDPLGGPDWRKGYSLLSPGGLLVACGLASATGPGKRSLLRVAAKVVQQPFFHCMRLMGDNRGVAGINLGHLWDSVDLLAREAEALMDLFAQGKIKPHVGGIYPFSRVGEAHAELEYGRNMGKIVLVPD